MPTVITSAGTAVAPSGRPSQSHLIYAENAALWWLFWVDGGSTGTLRTASSPDGVTWTARGTLTLSSNQDRGSNFAVAYKNISSTDVVMIGLNYYVSATQQRVRYVRATISSTTITFGTEGQIIADINTSDTSNNEGGIAVAFASDNYAHLAQSLAGGGGTSDYGWSYLSKATNADSGSSWTSGWPSTGVSMVNGSNYNNADVIMPAASGAMVWVGTDMAGYLAFTNLTYKIQSTWSANFTGNVLASGITSQDQNDWHACRVDDTHYHAVVRTGSNTFTHRTCNGSTWAAGASITNQNTKAGAGLFLASDGTDVWLFIVDSDAANTIRYVKYTTASGTWGSWTALVTTTKTRTFLSGYPIAKSSSIAIIWSEVNGSNKDIAIELLSLGGGTPATIAGQGGSAELISRGGQFSVPGAISGAPGRTEARAPTGTLGAGATLSGAGASLGVQIPTGSLSAGAQISGQAGRTEARAPSGQFNIPGTLTGSGAELEARSPNGTLAAATTISGPASLVQLRAPNGAFTIPGALSGSAGRIDVRSPNGSLDASGAAILTGTSSLARLIGPLGAFTIPGTIAGAGGRADVRAPNGTLSASGVATISGSGAVLRLIAPLGQFSIPVTLTGSPSRLEARSPLGGLGVSTVLSGPIAAGRLIGPNGRFQVPAILSGAADQIRVFGPQGQLVIGAAILVLPRGRAIYRAPAEPTIYRPGPEPTIYRPGTEPTIYEGDDS